ncbi:MAG: hypothetical protein M3400_15530 [Actinomycetota bacterium]|nr:hypothetical protein [Actinomycetota bacterium]
MARVLLGDFGAIIRLGLRDIVDDDERSIVAEETASDGILERLHTTLPDVVVLDLDAADSTRLAKRIAADYPAVKVVACSSARPQMRIFPPFHRGESYCCELSPTALVEAVRTAGK